MKPLFCWVLVISAYILLFDVNWKIAFAISLIQIATAIEFGHRK